LRVLRDRERSSPRMDRAAGRYKTRPKGAKDATEGSYGSRSETIEMRPKGAKEAPRSGTTAGGVERGAQPLFCDSCGVVGSRSGFG